MFMIKFFGKVLAIPIIMVISAILFMSLALDKVTGIFVGLLNFGIAAVILYSLIVIKDYYIIKRAILFFLGEGVLYTVFELVIGKLAIIKENLVMFVID